MEDPPKYQAPAPDPQIALLQQQTAQQNIAALSETARMDTARLSMLYGQTLALGNNPDLKAVMKAAPASSGSAYG